MRALLALLLTAAITPATAGSLQDCAGDARVVRCLERAKEVATEAMLERFLEVKQGLDALGGRRTELAAEALKQSQRAFERYIAEHCRGLLSMLGEGAAPALACETDLLRQRAAALEAIVAGNGDKI